MKERDRAFLELAINYLQVAENITNELVRQGNIYNTGSENPITGDELLENTKWSDYVIVEPLFFIFYHGLELMMKGCLLNNNNVIEDEHSVENLYIKFCNNYSERLNIISILSIYIGPNSNLVEPLRSFFNQNNITVNKYYEALKYPESRNASEIYRSHMLKDLGEKVIEFYKQFSQDISLLIKETVTFGRNNTQEK